MVLAGTYLDKRGNTMTTVLVQALTGRHGLPVVDETSIDAFLAPAAGEPPHAILFFTGDGAQRAETDDVAVVLPELLRAFGGRLRAAVVARSAEDRLKTRFYVYAMPSLAVTRDGEPVGVLPKVYDWADYIVKINAFLEPGAPALTPLKGPRAELSHSHGG
jgi:hydrogenase-1 operon protein HyaE